MKSKILENLKLTIDELTETTNCNAHPQLSHKLSVPNDLQAKIMPKPLSLMKKTNPNYEIINFIMEPNYNENALRNYLHLNREKTSKLTRLSLKTNPYKSLSRQNIPARPIDLRKQIADDFVLLSRKDSLIQQLTNEDYAGVVKICERPNFSKKENDVVHYDASYFTKNNHEKFISTLYEDLAASCEYLDFDHTISDRKKTHHPIVLNPRSNFVVNVLKANSPPPNLIIKNSIRSTRYINSSRNQNANDLLKKAHGSRDPNVSKKHQSVSKRNLSSAQISKDSRSHSLKQPKSSEINLRRQFENCRMMFTTSENVYTDLFPNKKPLRSIRSHNSNTVTFAQKCSRSNSQRGQKEETNFKLRTLVNPCREKKFRKTNVGCNSFRAEISSFPDNFQRGVIAFIKTVKEHAVPVSVNCREIIPKSSHKHINQFGNKKNANRNHCSQINPKQDSARKTSLTNRQSLYNSSRIPNHTKPEHILFEAYYLRVNAHNQTQNDSEGHLKSCTSSVTHHVVKSESNHPIELKHCLSKETYNKDESARFTPRTILASQLSTHLLNENGSKKSRPEFKLADLKRSISIEVRSRETSIKKIFSKFKDSNALYKTNNTPMKESKRNHIESGRKRKVFESLKSRLAVQNRFSDFVAPFSFLSKPPHSTGVSRKSKAGSIIIPTDGAVTQQTNDLFFPLKTAQDNQVDCISGSRPVESKLECPYLTTDEFSTQPKNAGIKFDQMSYQQNNDKPNKHNQLRFTKLPLKSDSFRKSAEKFISKNSNILAPHKSRLPITMTESINHNPQAHNTSKTKQSHVTILNKGAITNRTSNFLRQCPKINRNGHVGMRKNDKFLSGASVSLMLKPRKPHPESSTTDKEGLTSFSTLNHVNSFKFSNLQ
jgi:hypothetical protein